MPKINVYLPDDLADAVRDSGVPVSAICQRALEQSARRVAAIRAADLDAELELPRFTDRARTAIRLAVEAARADGAPEVGSGHLLRGVLDEGQNLALRVLAALDVDPGRVRAALPAGVEDGGATARFGVDAANALELTVVEATALGHNYVGCEHLLIGLAAEPDGAATTALRSVGLEVRAIRGAVSAALAGYGHLRAQGGEMSTSVIAAALKPLVERIEAIEARLR
ncbi:Clp protease N-terminal domain-containing protein [Actinokineospora guangxiensis]|uniref:Clp protease N-terminal domain-containing protein n=1 Tax=Actinokineospora guangxiensis TaxID=1490288 RepID=A0ABW0EQ11_9PSEU